MATCSCDIQKLVQIEVSLRVDWSPEQGLCTYLTEHPRGSALCGAVERLYETGISDSEGM